MKKTNRKAVNLSTSLEDKTLEKGLQGNQGTLSKSLEEEGTERNEKGKKTNTQEKAPDKAPGTNQETPEKVEDDPTGSTIDTLNETTSSEIAI